MAARAGMTPLIDELRRRCDAGTASDVIAGQTHWSDDDLQAILDGQRRDYARRPLLAIPAQQTGGSLSYQDYYWLVGTWVEGAESGTAVWRIEDSAGSIVGTAAYAVNSRAGHIRFTADTGGTVYYLTYRGYDLDRAAADVWEAKAAGVAARFDAATDNHDLKRGQLAQHYRDMAATYRRRAGVRAHARTREDVEC